MRAGWRWRCGCEDPATYDVVMDEPSRYMRPQITRPATERDIEIGRTHRAFSVALAAMIAGFAPFYVLMGIVAFMNLTPESSTTLGTAAGLTLSLCSIIGWVGWLFLAVLTWELVRRLGSGILGTTVIWLLTLIPLFGLLVLCRVDERARERAKAVGWECGLLGVSRKQLREASVSL